MANETNSTVSTAEEQLVRAKEEIAYLREQIKTGTGQLAQAKAEIAALRAQPGEQKKERIPKFYAPKKREKKQKSKK